ncbi:MAG: hypothetical protein K6E69_10315 [Treponema sp.]|uniref:sugar phosphate isomerase/epimerase family protein n=1 Tax=Treponema sp. TaxID=166 RepID=UPI00298D6828|nr:TIM barrel protein [Treponema sp.]MCR5387501.1 hypothetical protein [Treponema sp.]
MIKFGFQSSKYNSMTLEQELDFASNNKIDFFDVFFDGFTPNDIKTVELPDEYTFHLPIGFAELTSESQKEYFDYINEKKPVNITIHFCELTYETLEYICTQVPDTKVCIENTTPDVHKTYNINYIEFMKKAKELADEKGFKIYSTFDTGHAKINGFDAVEYAKKIFDLGIDIITLHLHDNDGKNDSHWAAGSVYNGINFGDVLDLFKKLKYDVNAVIEHWNNNYNALEYLQNL